MGLGSAGAARPIGHKLAMFSCFKPTAGLSQGEILLQLKRSRDDASHEAQILRQQLDKLLHEAQGHESKLQHEREARAHFERMAGARSANLQQLLANFSTLQAEVQEVVAAHRVSDPDAEPADTTPRETRSRDTSEPGAPAMAGSMLASMRKTVSQGGGLEVQVHEAMSKMNQSVQEAMHRLSLELATSQQQGARLESQLTTLRASKELLEAQAKSQREAFQVERSALESGCASLTELNGELTEQLESSQRALHAAVVARACAVEGEQCACSERDKASKELTDARRDLQAAQDAMRSGELVSLALQQQVVELREAEAASRLQILEVTTSATEHSTRAADLQTQLAASQSAAEAQAVQLADTQQQLAASTAQLAALKERAAAAQAQVTELSASLATSQQHSTEVDMEAAQLKEKLAQVQAELSISQAAATASSTALVTTKRDLVASSKQLAMMAREHGQALSSLGGTDEALAATTAKLQEATEGLVAARLDAAQARSKAAASTTALTTANQQATTATALAEQQSTIASQLRLLVRSLARLVLPSPGATITGAQAGVQGSNAPQGGAKTGGVTLAGGVTMSEEEVAACRKALVADGRLSLHLATAPLQLLACLATDDQACGALQDVTVEVDASAAPWEAVGLRAAGLAAALSSAPALRRVNLAGWAWGGAGEGLGVAAPFMLLLPLAQGVPLGTMHSMMPSMLQVQVDTQLVGVRCATLLSQLIAAGEIQLSVGTNMPGLQLYTDHEHVDSWYHQALASSGPHPAIHHPLTPSNLARNDPTSHDGSAHSHLSAPPSTFGTAVSSASNSLGGSAVGGGATNPQSGSRHGDNGMRSAQSAVGAAAAAFSAQPSFSVRSAQSAIVASQQQLGSLAGSSYGSSSARGVGGAGAAKLPFVDCELGDLGLESHHLVMVMVVLMTCPRVRRLHLDRNKVGDAGATILGLALPHSLALSDLSMSGNQLTREGVRALDPGAAPALRRLDLSAQHGPGGRTHTTGAPGAVEAVLASLKGSVTKAPRGAELQELDLSGLAVSEQGVAALVGLVSSNSCPMRRLVLSASLPLSLNHQSHSSRLQEAARHKPGFILSLQ